MKNIVFVQATDGSFVQHGPVRKSETQAVSVARQLSKKLGWNAVAAESAPAKSKAPANSPSVALAGLSPVWKDAGLAAKWNAGKSAAVATPAAK